MLSIATSAQNTAPDLTDLSLDQLSSIKVTSFAKKEQTLSHVAGAVYVITQEQIARSGLTSVPDLLRLVPGVDVEQVNGNQWSIAARGYNGVFANKLLVLIDGRSLYSPIFAGVYWELGMPMLEDIDRIEVIRGPGATIWGANAVLGVINIITKKTSDTQGTLITGGGGTTERAFGGARFGGTVGSTTYRVSGYGADHGQLQNANGIGANDGSSSEQGAFRLDHTGEVNGWTIDANFFRDSANANGYGISPQGQSLVLAPATLDSITGNITGVWHRKFGDTADLRIQSYYEYVDRPQPQASGVSTYSWDNELQLDFVAAKRHNLSVGAGERLIGSQVTSEGAYTFNPPNATYADVDGFIQDEIHFLNDRVLFTAGAKLEDNHFGGTAFEPSANLLWLLNKKQSVWTSVARAVRTPNLFESSVNAPIFTTPGSAATEGLATVVEVVGASGFGNELVNDFEAGYRAELTKRLSLDIDLFYDRAFDVRSFVPGVPSLVIGSVPYLLEPLTVANGVQAAGKGAEGAFSWEVTREWKLSGSYTYNALNTWTNADAPPGSLDASGGRPTHNKVKLQSYWNPTQRLQFDVLAYWSSQADPYSAAPITVNIPPYWRLDARLGFRINPHWQLSIAGQNLLQPRHLEGVPELLTVYSEVTRGAYLKSTW